MKYNKQTKNSIAKTQSKANSGKSVSNSAPARQNRTQSSPSGKRKMREQEITINLGALKSSGNAQSQSSQQGKASSSRTTTVKRPQKSSVNGKKASKNSKSRKKRNKHSSQSYNEQAKKQARIQSSREQMRQSNAVRHKMRRKRNYTLHYILLGILFIITIVTLSYTVLFNIQHIEITENPILSDEKIIAAANVKIGDNLLRTNTKKAELKVLNSTIYFDRVKISRKFPSTLNVKIDIASPTMGVRYGGMYYYFSKNDRLIEIAKKEEHPNIPIAWGVDLNKIKLGEYLIASDKNEYETVQMLYEQIEKAEFKGVTAVDVRDPANVKLYYEHRIEIQLGSLQELDYKFKIAKEILDTKIENEEFGILDVQISGKAYFRVAENTSQPK